MYHQTNIKTKTMTTQNEKTTAIINGNERGIYFQIKNWSYNVKKDNLIGDTLLELIYENSTNVLNKNMALRLIDNDINPTKEDAIELTYEISRNKDFYLNLMINYNDKCKDDALDVLREIHPSKTDSELKLLMH